MTSHQLYDRPSSPKQRALIVLKLTAVAALVAVTTAAAGAAAVSVVWILGWLAFGWSTPPAPAALLAALIAAYCAIPPRRRR